MYLNADCFELRNNEGLLQERFWINKDTGNVIGCEVFRHYDKYNPCFAYHKYAWGGEVIRFENNSIERHITVEITNFGEGICEAVYYGSNLFDKREMTIEAYELIKKILHKLKNDKDINFRSLYDTFIDKGKLFYKEG